MSTLAAPSLTPALQAPFGPAVEGGSVDGLVGQVYGELRQLARCYLSQERRGHTLQPTALVNEAYLQLARMDRITWRNRKQFFALAAQAMRHILVDHARARACEKRGGGLARVTLSDGVGPEGAAPQIADSAEGSATDLLDLDEALTELSQMDPDLARLVELRYFAGLTIEETARNLGTSPATVKRDWLTARSWLHGRLAKR